MIFVEKIIRDGLTSLFNSQVTRMHNRSINTPDLHSPTTNTSNQTPNQPIQLPNQSTLYCHNPSSHPHSPSGRFRPNSHQHCTGPIFVGWSPWIRLSPTPLWWPWPRHVELFYRRARCTGCAVLESRRHTATRSSDAQSLHVPSERRYNQWQRTMDYQ